MKDDVIAVDKKNVWGQGSNISWGFKKSNSKEPLGEACVFLKGEGGEVYHFDSHPWRMPLQLFELILKSQ